MQEDEILKNVFGRKVPQTFSGRLSNIPKGNIVAGIGIAIFLIYVGYSYGATSARYMSLTGPQKRTPQKPKEDLHKNDNPVAKD